jgi:hypothetical protein
MKIDFLHIIFATTVLLLWLVIVVGWLVTCRHGETTPRPSRGKVPPRGQDTIPSIVCDQKSAA